MLAPPGRGLEKAIAGELVSFGAVLRLLLQEQRLLPSWAGGRTPRAPTATTTTATTHQVSFLPSWLTSAGVIACGGDCCCSLHGCRRCSARIRGSMRISHGRYSPPHTAKTVAHPRHQPPCALSTSLLVAGVCRCVTDRILDFAAPKADETAVLGGMHEIGHSCREWVRLVKLVEASRHQISCMSRL